MIWVIVAAVALVVSITAILIALISEIFDISKWL